MTPPPKGYVQAETAPSYSVDERIQRVLARLRLLMFATSAEGYGNITEGVHQALVDCFDDLSPLADVDLEPKAGAR
ncbi:MAG TPA: hypothetical protein VNZ26_12620 [Vicinamibacterales bacterium]|jgi:hypothetical protein|nr:hypothetical protein [Vicinamibacterales bacterium]